MVQVSIRVKAETIFGMKFGEVTDYWIEDNRKMCHVEWDDGTAGTWPWSDLWIDTCLTAEDILGKIA